MQFKPLADRILVKQLSEEEISEGGILIPPTAQEKPFQGEVIAVGNGKVLEDGSIRPVDVQPGDHILFGKYAGSTFKLDGDEHMILREDEVLGVLED